MAQAKPDPKYKVFQLMFVAQDTPPEPGDKVQTDQIYIEQIREEFAQSLTHTETELRKLPTFSERAVKAREWIEQLKAICWTPDRTLLIKRPVS